MSDLIGWPASVLIVLVLAVWLICGISRLANSTTKRGT
jgi:hypothetical protein